MTDEAARCWWAGPGGGRRPDPRGWWPEPDSLHWVRTPEPVEEHPPDRRRPDPARPA